MSYTPNDIYKYIMESGKEADVLQAMLFQKQKFSIAEITDKKFRIKENNEVIFISKNYKLHVPVTDDDIITAVLNGLYVSAFISRYKEEYNVHFLVHAYPETKKAQFEDAILKEVVRYMIMMTIVRLRLDTPQKVKDYLK